MIRMVRTCLLLPQAERITCGLWFSVQEEEGGAQDGDHGRQAAAEHAQEGGRQHHPGHRGGQHLQGRPRHPVPQPQR